MDELLKAFCEAGRGVGRKCEQSMEQREMIRPYREEKSEAKYCGDDLIRGLQGISKCLFPHQSLDIRLVRRYIKENGLPAVKHKLGWVARVGDLWAWRDRFFLSDAE